MTELISVIIANYNRSDLLEKAIQSIINQKSDIPFSWEIIIVDDGSTDNSRDIIEWYTQSYPDSIRAIYQKNQGVNVARNVGINALSEKSTYTIILDNDDEVTLWSFDVYLKRWHELGKQWRYDSIFTIISYCQDEHGTILWDKKILWGKLEVPFNYKDYLRTFFELREMMSMDKSSTYRDNPEFRFDEKQLIGEAILWAQIYKKMYEKESGALIIDHIGRLFRLHHGPRTSHNIKPERFINSAKSNEKILQLVKHSIEQYWFTQVLREFYLRIGVNYCIWWYPGKWKSYLWNIVNMIDTPTIDKIIPIILILLPRPILYRLYIWKIRND